MDWRAAYAVGGSGVAIPSQVVHFITRKSVDDMRAAIEAIGRPVSKLKPKLAGGEESNPGAAPDLRRALTTRPEAGAKWNELTPIARRDFLSWIDAAKQSETRQRRIERTCSMLAEGKRRPCCYSIVSLDLHLALKANPAAKSTWSDLNPDERRDFIGWMDLAKERSAHRLRIREACAMMAAGRRKPRT